MPPEFYFLKSDASNSKLSPNYTDYSNTYELQAYKYVDGNDKSKYFGEEIDDFLLNKCNITMEDPLLPSHVLTDMYSSKNSHLFPSNTQPEVLGTSIEMQNAIDPNLFSEKDAQKVSSVSDKMQLLSPPYSSVQYDENFARNFRRNGYKEQNQKDFQPLTDHCSQLRNDFRTSIHQLASQIFSPPTSPKSNTVMDFGDPSQGITYFEKSPFNQFLLTVPFNNKDQHNTTSSNGIVGKSTTFGRFSSRRTMVSLEAISSFIQGPEKSDGKFVCLYNGCLKRFGRKYNIQSHIQTHLSDRPYCCPVCRARFVRHHDLKRHVKIHGDQKPYCCPCGKSFVRADALKRHRVRGICKGSITC
ncbi:hypothetical protein PORY_002245 [Pneumocystis oryctolagi]|uniref:Uncharacterized protein n=1 Tax=Pneumocystis oryctolagi TaxID=42067 RepID=A0ACB7CB60_9ASCO|nr:hypothetical protein PORY_002245 [Pneumocystis oryctolagi]